LRKAYRRRPARAREAVVSHGLPGVLAEIAEAAGADAAWELARAVGGTTVYIPRAVGPEHWLAKLLGLEAANRICRHFQVGADILIPMGRAGHQKVRLVKALEDGMSAPEAALAAGMHERSAYRARRRLKRRDDDQLELL
jgi:hypothetical protein